MAIAILDRWRFYFDVNRAEGLGSSYERVVLNRRLNDLRQQYDVHTVLEAPAFGFTGLSGINSMDLARKGAAVTLLDHDPERVDRIRGVWAEVNLPLTAQAVKGYDTLPFDAQSFDMSWNFAAIWYERLGRVPFRACPCDIQSDSHWHSQSGRAGISLGKRRIGRGLERQGPRRLYPSKQDHGVDAPVWMEVGPACLYGRAALA